MNIRKSTDWALLIWLMTAIMIALILFGFYKLTEGFWTSMIALGFD